MKPSDQIEILAEADGWTPWVEEEYPHRAGFAKDDGAGEKCLKTDMPDYLTSWDAIIPLAQKVGVYPTIFTFKTPADVAEDIICKLGKWKY